MPARTKSTRNRFARVLARLIGSSSTGICSRLSSFIHTPPDVIPAIVRQVMHNITIPSKFSSIVSPSVTRDAYITCQAAVRLSSLRPVAGRVLKFALPLPRRLSLTLVFERYIEPPSGPGTSCALAPRNFMISKSRRPPYSPPSHASFPFLTGHPLYARV